MDLLKDAAHLALARRRVDRKKMLGHNPAAVGLTQRRTEAMTACVPGPAEMSRATAVVLLYRH